MKEYYYLKDSVPVGPFSLEELRALHLDEKISLDTLISKEGAAEWLQYAEFLPKKVEAQLPPVPTAAPASASEANDPFVTAKEGCPYCKCDISINEDRIVPYVCPKCFGDIHAKERGLWDYFTYAFGKYATFKGRATRAEFWSYMLVATLLGFGISVVGVIIPFIGFIFQLAILIPSLAVLFRRFHDVGLSGWWVILLKAMPAFSATAAIIYFYKLVVDALGGVDKLGEHVAKLIEYSNEAGPGYNQELLQVEYGFFKDAFVQAWQQAGVTLALCAIVVPVVCLISILIVCIMDSKRGVNKYGVSTKYPM